VVCVVVDICACLVFCREAVCLRLQSCWLNKSCDVDIVGSNVLHIITLQQRTASPLVKLVISPLLETSRDTKSTRWTAVRTSLLTPMQSAWHLLSRSAMHSRLPKSQLHRHGPAQNSQCHCNASKDVSGAVVDLLRPGPSAVPPPQQSRCSSFPNPLQVYSVQTGGSAQQRHRCCQVRTVDAVTMAGHIH